MAVSPGQRLKKAAAKAVKRKAVVAEKLAAQRRELRISKPRHVDLANSPLAACLLSAEIEKAGMGALIVARKLTLGRYATAVFLLDLWCLGVKDAFFRVDESDDFDAFREEMAGDGALEPIEPARARRLVRDAAAYGAANGFSPPPELAEMTRLLGSVEPAGEPFAFGDNGRPHYMVGEYDSDRQVAYVMSTLTEKFGENGFDVTYPLEYDGGGDEEPLN